MSLSITVRRHNSISNIPQPLAVEQRVSHFSSSFQPLTKIKWLPDLIKFLRSSSYVRVVTRQWPYHSHGRTLYTILIGNLQAPWLEQLLGRIDKSFLAGFRKKWSRLQFKKWRRWRQNSALYSPLCEFFYYALGSVSLAVLLPIRQLQRQMRFTQMWWNTATRIETLFISVECVHDQEFVDHTLNSFRISNAILSLTLGYSFTAKVIVSTKPSTPSTSQTLDKERSVHKLLCAFLNHLRVHVHQTLLLTHCQNFPLLQFEHFYQHV
jgi:hypothetical protein